jgi:hypothetical protein
MATKDAVSTEQIGESQKEVCFVIMPFGGWLDDYYVEIYSPAIRAVGLRSHRADDLFRPSTIINDIWSYTKKAKVLLADLTGKNANVFYELGLAHALGKPAILVAESMEDIPFDLRALRIILFDKNAPDWGQRLKEKIESSLKEVLQSPVEAVLPAFLDVKSTTSKPTVSSEQRDFIEIKQELDLLRRELRSRNQLGTFASLTVPSNADSLREVIIDWAKAGVPESNIMRRAAEMGVSMDWTDRVLRAAEERGVLTRRQWLVTTPRVVKSVKPTITAVKAKPKNVVNAKAKPALKAR